MNLICLKNLPIRRKLSVMVMLTSGLALLLACSAFMAYEQLSFRRAMVRDLSITAQMIGDNCAVSLSFNEAGSAEQILRTLNAQPHVTGAAIYGRDGKVFALYRRTNATPAFLPPQRPTPGHQFARGYLALSLPIQVAGETLGIVHLQSDVDEVRERRDRYGLIALGVLLGALAAAFLVSRRMQKGISDPIFHLAEVAGRVASEKSYAVRATKHGTDELGSLIDSFNSMLEEIQKRDVALQKSHEVLEEKVNERTQSLRDEVAERKRSEEALRQSEARVRTIVETALDAVVAMDEGGGIVDWNPQAETIFGWSRSEVMGRRFSDLVLLPEYQKEYEEFFHSPATGEFPLSRRVEIQARDRQGMTLDIELAMSAMRTDGKMAFSAFIRDIGERKRMEALLANERQVLELMASGAALPVVLDLLARNTEGLANGMLCSILLLDDEGQHLLHGAAPSLPEAYSRAIHGVAVGPEVGSCGTAVWRKQIVVVEDIAADPLWRNFKHVALSHGLQACWSRPICSADGRVIGTFAVYHRKPHRPTLDEMDFVERAASQARIAIERKRAEAELDRIHKQLMEASRKAGMAEVATGVLHNVGNVLNSVNVSSTLVADTLKKSKLPNLSKAAAMLVEHEHDMADFLTHDPKGRHLRGYFAQIAEHLASEHAGVLKELEHLQKNIGHIKDIVTMQQAYAKTSGISEVVNILDLVQDCLKLNSSSLTRNGIQVVREFAELPPVAVEKHKLLQILINLIRNAGHACEASGREDRQITVRVHEAGERIRILIIDNGVGIPPENLNRIFNHGFTTKKDGHGFGLHSGALAAREMGGSLTVQSEGEGRGATFILELPAPPAKQKEAA